MNKLSSLLRKKVLLAVLSAGVIGSAAYAFAATLDVQSSSLGAGNASVGTCADSARATYTTGYDAALSTGRFAVKTVTLTFGPGTTCTNGDKLEVVLADNSNNALASFIYTVGASDTIHLGSKTLTATAGSLTPDGTGYVDGLLSAGPDGSDFTGPAAAPTTATAIPAASVFNVAVSAAGA